MASPPTRRCIGGRTLSHASTGELEVHVLKRGAMDLEAIQADAVGTSPTRERVQRFSEVDRFEDEAALVITRPPEFGDARAAGGGWQDESCASGISTRERRRCCFRHGP